MRTNRSTNPRRRVVCGLAVALLAPVWGAGDAAAQDSGPRLDLYGFVMADMGYQSGQNDPDWFDVLRPTRLPAFEDEYGRDGRTFFSVRQTRFGAQAYIPTDLGQLHTIFEWELFGTGVDAGQTTLRLRHAYGELGQFGAGQYWSPFMDIDVFPNSVEYWGPNGMVFFRNVQARWMPIQGDTRMTIALERPGASGDQGIYADRVELDGIQARFPLPDLSAEYRLGTSWGYVELAGILRRIQWDDVNDDDIDLSDEVLGWGLNLSSNVRTGTGTVRLQAVYGEGVQNYMNDAPVDVGIESNPGDPDRPVLGVPLPLLGIVAFYDHTWNDRFTSSVGYSMLDIDNSDGQDPSAFKRGHYALGNLLYTPVPGVMMGGELQWGRRENFADDWTVNDVRVQFSFRYNYSFSIGG